MKIINFEDLVNINKAVCNKTGEPFHILNKDSLLSALSVQDNNYYANEDLMSSALLRSLVISHGFEQGNKRTAFLAIVMSNLPACDPKALSSVILDIAKGELKDIEKICEIIYNHK